MDIRNLNFEFDPITEVTKDNLDKIKIHPTYDSLRLAIGANVAVVLPPSDKVPTLYYIKSISDGSVSIHALSTDIHKFILSSVTK